MKNFKIREKMLMGFGWILMLIIILNGFAIWGQRKLSNITIEMYNGPHENSIAAVELTKYVRELDSVLNNMIIKQQVGELKKDYQEVKKNAQAKIDYLTSKGVLTEDQKSTFQTSMAEMEKSGLMVIYYLNKGNVQMAGKQMTENFDLHMEKVAGLADSISETASSDAKAFFEESYSEANFVIVVQDIIFVIIVFASIATALKMARDIVRPINIIGGAMDQVEQGNFSIDLQAKSQDEFGILTQQLMGTVERIKTYIKDITYVLGDISKGNIDLSVSREYVGDFSEIKTSLNMIIDSLNETMRQISQCSQQVRISAMSLSDGAQSLAKGSQEQTATLENFQIHLDKVVELTAQDGKNASEVNTISKTAWDKIQESDKQMKDMVAAMHEINESSNEIAKIIKLIEDIAFQTNILALNAAVEAARAGSAGKGFAVVADEVRNLAGKSADAAENTSNMITKAIDAVQNGMQIANQAASSIRKVGDHVKQMKTHLEVIDESTNEQANAFNEMMTAIDQIAIVVHTNSSSAEENSTAAEELSMQAELLEQHIHRFNLRQSEKTLLLK